MTSEPLPVDGVPAAEIETGICGIGEMARAFNVSQRTLRFYEDRGLLMPRRDGATRLYDRREQRRLALILRGKRLGFTLTEISSLVAADGSGAAALSLDRDQITLQISHLEKQRDGLNNALAELRATLRSLDPP